MCQTLAEYLPISFKLYNNLMSRRVVYKVTAQDTGDKSLRHLAKVAQPESGRARFGEGGKHLK